MVLGEFNFQCRKQVCDADGEVHQKGQENSIPKEVASYPYQQKDRARETAKNEMDRLPMVPGVLHISEPARTRSNAGYLLGVL